ncbi:MAG TPA: substrate-binding domain-containing protein, partial [Kiloniellales bacterium]|nr:substrate-binding domain-containing protein [Kiloniellales bacterium]
TDAAITPRVRIAGLFPPESHPPIRYPLATVAGRDRPAVRAAAAFLRGSRARAIFEAHGFAVLEPAAGS